MSHFPEDLRTFIIGTTAITGLVSTRVHYNLTPQVSARPNIWFRVTSDTEERTMDGAGGMHEAYADIERVGLTEASAQNVGDAVKTRLDGYKGACGNSSAKGIFLTDKDDDYMPFAIDADEGAHVVAFTAHCWYTT